jgi:hypothetical protein
MIKKENNSNKSKLSREDFLEWIKTAEKSPKVSLEEFNERWEAKKLEIYKIYQF